MRFYAFIACLLVALDCARNATGSAPQFLLAHDALWLWWIAAGTWVVVALGQLGRD